MMVNTASEDQLLGTNALSFIQLSKKPIGTSQQFQLYQSIISFTNELKDHNQLIHILNHIENERIFDALLAHLLQQSQPQTQHTLTSFLLHYIEQPHSKFKSNLVLALLKQRAQHLEPLINNCKSSQAKTQMILAQINGALVGAMRTSPITNLNFTPSTLLALKCIEYAQYASASLVQQSLRHLLIVNCIQKGQITKILLESPVLIDKLQQLGRRQLVSGFWFYLLAKIAEEANSQNTSFQKIAQIVDQTFARSLSVIEAGKDLNDQIDKIMFSPASAAEKLNLLYQLRGFIYFINCHMQLRIQLGAKQQRFVQLIEKFLQIKDFACFEYSLKTYLTAIDNGLVSKEIAPAVAKSIQQNCLPLLQGNKYTHSEYNPSELNFYSFALEDRFSIVVSSEGSCSMDRILQLIMESRECTEKHEICQCCEEYIHSSIEKQYDHEFNPHQFMSACHLMCRQIARVVRLQLEAGETLRLKEYLVTNLKWLLNLNESCPPQYRKCINFKIFDLMTSFPPLFRNNHFLQEVIQDLLIARLPETLPHLHRFLASYQSLLTEANESGLGRLCEKLLKKIEEERFTIQQKIHLWEIIVGIWERDERKLGELQELSIANEDDAIAQYLVLKSKKLKVLERTEARALQIQEKIQSNRLFYAHHLHSMHLHSK